MSVFNHDYRPYEGQLTPLSSRPLVLARYALHEAWSSKITIGLFVLSLLPCLVELVTIYVADNPIARALIMRGGPSLTIGEAFFLKVLETQCWFALVLAAWIAPRLVSFDLSDNALPILLSHPISRFGYLLGKFLALALSLSYVTWIPVSRAICLPVLRVAAAVGDGAPVTRVRYFRWRGRMDRAALIDRAWRFQPG